MATHMLGKAVRITTVNVCDRKERFVRKLTVVCCFPLCRSGIRSVFIAALGVGRVAFAGQAFEL